MNRTTPLAAQDRLATTLIERLRPIAADPARPRGGDGLWRCGPNLFSYCRFTVERIAQLRSPVPLIGIVVSGSKEVWLGDTGQTLEAGAVFVLPAGLALDVVNRPDERRGRYEALVVEVPSVPPELALPPAPPHKGLDVRLPLTPELVETLAHAASALRDTEQGAMQARYRMGELLVLLRGVPAARSLFTVPLTDRIAWIVCRAPDRAWTAAGLGRELGLGGSTLRRRLAGQGTSLRAVLAAARMSIAHRLLASGEGSVADAACAAGYTSRSHFARRFRRVYGYAPRHAEKSYTSGLDGC